MRTPDNNRIKLQGFVSLLSGNLSVLVCLMYVLLLNSFMYPLNALQLSAASLCLTLCDPMDCYTPGCITNSWSLLKLTSIKSWCDPTILSSVIPFSSCSQSFPASGSFPVSELFTSGGQSIGVSASTSILPTNTQDWSPLGWTDWIPLQSKGLWRVFSNTTVQKHQFFSAQLSL